MNPAALEHALALARKLGHVFLATADKAGVPHVAAAGKIEPSPRDRVRVSAWFCPGTMADLAENPHVALVIWDPAEDQGYQLIGKTEQVSEAAMIDGIAPGEERSSVPQVEWELSLRVRKILQFTHAPHTDVEEKK